jgi:hypothetical protein
MWIGDRARFETESREASEFDSPSHRWRGFPSLVNGLRWNRSVRKDTSVQIALPPWQGDVVKWYDTCLQSRRWLFESVRPYWRF